MRPIAYKYREGKVKSTSSRRVKESLKPCAYKRSEPFLMVTACLLHNEPTSYHYRQGEGVQHPSRSESEPEEGVKSVGVDAKPSDLHLTRMKFR